jgi:hypothetical protein
MQLPPWRKPAEIQVGRACRHAPPSGRGLPGPPGGRTSRATLHMATVQPAQRAVDEVFPTRPRGDPSPTGAERGRGAPGGPSSPAHRRRKTVNCLRSPSRFRPERAAAVSRVGSAGPLLPIGRRTHRRLAHRAHWPHRTPGRSARPAAHRTARRTCDPLGSRTRRWNRSCSCQSS